MNKRRLVYIVLVLLVLWYVYDSTSSSYQRVDLLSQKEILAEFDSQPEDSWINFPANYAGDSGDMFYVGVIKDGQPVTTVYRIAKNEQGEYVYEVRDEWQGVRLPVNRFDTYVRTDGEWIKQK